MKSKARDSLIGLTAIAGFVLLSWMLMSFGELSGLGQKYQTVVIRTPTARGISPVSPVSLNGVRIGDVTGIKLAPDGSGEAVLSVRYKEDIQIPADFELFLDAGFIGSASLDFVTSPGPHSEFIAGKGEEYSRNVSSLVDSLTAEVSARLDRLDETADRIDTLAVTYTDVGERLANVIDSQDPAVEDLNSMLTRIDSVLVKAESWFDEGAMMAQISDSVNQWKAAAKAIAEQTEQLGARADESLTKLDSAVVSIDQAAGEARDIAARINQGEGTLGQLSTNADLYRSLDATIRQLQTLIRDGQLLIEKFRDEGVPISL
jgi:phospholipid/cholesterol/gamma-HCH transport system substrate-binding protein